MRNELLTAGLYYSASKKSQRPHPVLRRLHPPAPESVRAAPERSGERKRTASAPSEPHLLPAQGLSYKLEGTLRLPAPPPLPDNQKAQQEPAALVPTSCRVTAITLPASLRLPGPAGSLPALSQHQIRSSTRANPYPAAQHIPNESHTRCRSPRQPDRGSLASAGAQTPGTLHHCGRRPQPGWPRGVTCAGKLSPVSPSTSRFLSKISFPPLLQLSPRSLPSLSSLSTSLSF